MGMMERGCADGLVNGGGDRYGVMRHPALTRATDTASRDGMKVGWAGVAPPSMGCPPLPTGPGSCRRGRPGAALRGPPPPHYPVSYGPSSLHSTSQPRRTRTAIPVAVAVAGRVIIVKACVVRRSNMRWYLR